MLIMKKELVALITGGSRGIGLGIAKALANERWNLIITGRSEESLVEQTIDSLKSCGASVLYLQSDISHLAGHANILKIAKEKFGNVNLLVNNAGIAPKNRADLLDLNPDSYDEVMDTNLKGPLFFTQSIAKEMVQNKLKDNQFYATIINIGSVSANMASVNRGEYCISKSGIAMLTKLFASRLGDYGISVFEVRPGIIATDMTANVKAKYDKLIEEGLMIQKRWGTPEDIGSVVAALARGDFPYSTGQVIMVDGGMNLSRL